MADKSWLGRAQAQQNIQKIVFAGAWVAGGAGAGSAAASGLSAVASAAIPVAIALGAVALSAFSVKKFFDFIQSETERLARYSPELAAQQGRSELRQMQAEMRAAERLGPELARFEESRSRAAAELTDAGTEIKLILLKTLEPMLPAIQGIAEIIHGIATSASEGAIANVAKGFWDLGSDVGHGLLGAFGFEFLIDYLKRNAERAEADGEFEDEWMNRLFSQLVWPGGGFDISSPKPPEIPWGWPGGD